MEFVQSAWSRRLLRLLIVWFFTIFSESCSNTSGVEVESVNLSMRRTVDLLLRNYGDSVSPIPPVIQTATGVWRVKVEQAIDYDLLPDILQASFEIYHINEPYEVALRGCLDDIIELGYHRSDVGGENWIPCQGRERSSECYTIEVIFPEIKVRASSSNTGIWLAGVVLLCLFIWFGIQLLNQEKKSIKSASGLVFFGNSTLDVSGQELNCAGQRHLLTFREAKLLHVFVLNIDQLVEREQLLRVVWAEEGVQVSRSLDVFVSRLRKKLSGDTSLSIIAVHGVGYRLQRSGGADPSHLN